MLKYILFCCIYYRVVWHLWVVPWEKIILRFNISFFFLLRTPSHKLIESGFRRISEPDPQCSVMLLSDKVWNVGRKLFKVISSCGIQWRRWDTKLEPPLTEVTKYCHNFGNPSLLANLLLWLNYDPLMKCSAFGVQ